MQINLKALLPFLTLLVFLSACDGNNGVMEEAGEDADRAIEDAGDAMKDVGDDIEDATDGRE